MSRKQVTVANDDGRVRWGDLSPREKAARTTQKTFYLGLVLTGLVMTVWRPPKTHCRVVTKAFRAELDTCCIPTCLRPIVGLVFSTAP